ncbi:helix-turn-helix transcriptional regulator [Lactobacillus sp. ESL0680]|uniref:helix-turn-helix domain-containing protein n=1 Tax=Lactobacillus sp. ESL0680 TaxID=2983210 RepID=UPI0023F6AFF7|nr:helix-turn-helix transcriptional regulator [Lactobacillus sp. ESL0680]WEV38482.1 helix-turn-helix transcriptional regulator [Lactobacillus sp. ESL0680]
MKKFGEILRKTRKDIGITQMYLANKTIDRTTISKIESGMEEPYYENGVALIHNLGISMDEFEYIRRGYMWSSKEKLIYEFMMLSYSTQEDLINQLLVKLDLFDKDLDISRIKLILQAFKSINEHDGDITLAKKIVQPIWFDFLAQVDNWKILDLYILNKIFFIFDEDVMEMITNKAIKIIENHYPFLKELETSFILNRSRIRMNSHNVVAALRDLAVGEKLAQEVYQYDKLLVAKCRIAICKNDKLTAEYYASLASQIGAKEIALSLKDEIFKFILDN